LANVTIDTFAGLVTIALKWLIGNCGANPLCSF
jgi:hypothetical protein